MSIKIKLPQVLEPVRIALIGTAVQSSVLQMKSKEKITCKVACTGCCSRHTQISIAEAIIIYEHLRVKKEWHDVRKQAKDQAKIARNIEPLSWFKLNIKCSILNLETKLCRAYMVRPAVCSTHFVSSDPDLCDPWSHKSGKFITVDMNNLYFKFKNRLENSIDGFGVFGMHFPIPSALLIAEKISVQSDMDLAQVMSLIRTEL